MVKGFARIGSLEGASSTPEVAISGSDRKPPEARTLCANDMRNSPAALIVSGCIFFLLGALASAAFFWKAQQPVLRHVASAGRMPIPGRADMQLTARTYGVYFGMLNPPPRRVMNVPGLKLKFTAHDGAPGPQYVDLPSEQESRVEGFETVQIGRLVVHAAGEYHVEVASPESVGSFSIGELPSAPSDDDKRHAILTGLVVGGISLALCFALVSSGVRARRDEARVDSGRSSRDAR
jgi:hypothetical protein